MKTLPSPIAVLAAVLLAAAPATAWSQTSTSPAVRLPDVIYVPTPQNVVDAMLKLADVKQGETVYDLGCGDGRAVITAARDFGAKGIGVDIDPQRINESIANAQAAGVTSRVQFKQEDLFQMQIDDADVLFLYLLPRLNLKLRPRILDELRPGTRVVSHAFTMGDWEADEKSRVNGSSVFFWVVPAKVAGEWTLTLPDGEKGTLALTQEFQTVKGTLETNGHSWPVVNGKLRGSTLSFNYGEGENLAKATAEVTGKQLKGTVQVNGSEEQKPVSGVLTVDRTASLEPSPAETGI